MYIVNVDLWNEDGTQEVNLVRHSGSTPSISSTTPTSFAQVQNSMAHPPILPAQDQTGGHVAAFQNPPSVNPFTMGAHMGSSQSPQGSSTHVCTCARAHVYTRPTLESRAAVWPQRPRARAR